MRIIDTHSHIYSEIFLEDLQSVVSRAKAICVEKILLPNIDVDSIVPLKETVKKYPNFFFPMMGLHPTSVGEDFKEQLAEVKKEFDTNNYIAVGEIGIDLYWDKSYKKEQIQAFEEQLKWSVERNLPVSIHSREAIFEVIDSIKRVGEKSLRGVFHSFGGNSGELEAILNLKNFYIGINGVVTFKNSGLAETLKNCPIEKIILETDAPYLAPVPYRGKRNEPAYLAFVLKTVSQIYGLSEVEISIITTTNAEKLFNI